MRPLPGCSCQSHRIHIQAPLPWHSHHSGSTLRSIPAHQLWAYLRARSRIRHLYNLQAGNARKVAIVRSKRATQHYSCGGYPCVSRFQPSTASLALAPQSSAGTYKRRIRPSYMVLSQVFIEFASASPAPTCFVGPKLQLFQCLKRRYSVSSVQMFQVC